MKKKHRQNITWRHRWACVHNNHTLLWFCL